MLRPERVGLTAKAGPLGVSLAIMIEDVAFLGNRTSVAATAEWQERLRIQLNFGHSLNRRLARGNRLYIRWLTGTVHLFVREKHA